jgi:uncharacterized protein
VELEPVPPLGRLLVQAYGPGGFTIAGRRHDGAVLLNPESVLPWRLASPDALDAIGLGSLRNAEPPVDLLIFGTAASFWLLPQALRAELRGWGIAAEAMTTPAACRTYNVLAGEGRRVAAALLPMPSTE